MTTTVDPYGSQETIFNRSGATIQEVSAPIGSLVQLSSSSGVSNFIVSVTGSGTVSQSDGVILPDDSQVGDVVNIFTMIGQTLWVHAPGGENINGYSDLSIGSASGMSLLKYNDTSWVRGR